MKNNEQCTLCCEKFSKERVGILAECDHYFCSYCIKNAKVNKKPIQCHIDGKTINKKLPEKTCLEIDSNSPNIYKK